MTTDNLIQTYEFDSFSLDVREAVLRRDGKPVPLTAKAFETLVVLIENSGQTVSRDELMRRVWDDCFVEENCLTKNISTLRKALGGGANGADDARFIVTVPKRGYRFVAAVNQESEKRIEKNVGSLAVLPFKVFPAERNLEYLGLGMTDVLISRLSNLRQIAVRPTSAVRKYADAEQDAASVGRELQVDWILEGSLFQIGGRVRAVVQFIAVQDGRLLWGEKFDEELTDLLAVQDLISERVAETLLEKLAIEPKELGKPATADNRAFREYLEGRFYWNKRTAEAMPKAAACFERAIRIDPKFALAHAGLGDAYLLYSQFALAAPEDACPRAKAAALAAIRLDPGLAEAHATLGHIAYLFEWNWREAENHHRRAVALNPNYATAHHWYGIFLRSMRRFDESIAALRRALELDPLSPVILKNLGVTLARRAEQRDEGVRLVQKAIELAPDYALGWRSLGWIYLQQKQFKRSIEALEKAARLSHRDPAILSTLGCAYAASGREREAREILRELEEAAQKIHVSKYDVAQIFIKLGDLAKALDLLEKSFDEHDISLVLLAVDPDLDELRGDARFERLKKRVGL